METMTREMTWLQNFMQHTEYDLLPGNNNTHVKASFLVQKPYQPSLALSPPKYIRIYRYSKSFRNKCVQTIQSAK